MSDQSLRELVEQLHREIANLPDEDLDARGRLEAVVTELERKLEAPGNEDHQGLVENIQDSIQELEVRHPDATTLLNNIMMALANMGI